MGNYIVQVTDEDSGALMATWSFNQEQYVQLCAFVAWEGSPESDPNFDPMHKLKEELHWCLEEALGIAHKYFGTVELKRLDGETEDQIAEDMRHKDIAFKTILDYLIQNELRSED